MKKARLPSAETSADVRLLTKIITRATQEEFDADHPVCPAATVEAFESMLLRLNTGAAEELTPKQRKWAEDIWARLEGDDPEPEYLNLISSGKAPRGKEVPTPLILLNLPKKPPRRTT